MSGLLELLHGGVNMEEETEEGLKKLSFIYLFLGCKNLVVIKNYQKVPIFIDLFGFQCHLSVM